MLTHKQAIEAHLVKRLGELFELDYDLLLYDVTSTYFEGVADPQIAKRGYSRDQRPDCVQVNTALVVARVDNVGLDCVVQFAVRPASAITLAHFAYSDFM